MLQNAKEDLEQRLQHRRLLLTSGFGVQASLCLCKGLIHSVLATLFLLLVLRQLTLPCTKAHTWWKQPQGACLMPPCAMHNQTLVRNQSSAAAKPSLPQQRASLTTCGPRLCYKRFFNILRKLSPRNTHGFEVKQARDACPLVRLPLSCAALHFL